MRKSRFLEAATTKYLFITILSIASIIVVIFVIILAFGLIDITTLATFVDLVFKTIAIFIGTIWALNRYFIERTDVTQFRIDADVNLIPATKFQTGASRLALLIYRLDVVNTGTSIISNYKQYLRINSVTPSEEGIKNKLLYRWPSNDWHLGGSIEPGSWAAINDNISVPADTKAVLVYIEIELSKSSDLTNFCKFLS